MILCMLQNAWAYEERGAKLFREHPGFHLQRLSETITGKRISLTLGTTEWIDNYEELTIHGFDATDYITQYTSCIRYCICESTPVIGTGHHSAKLPPDLNHCRRIFDLPDIEIVISFGKQANQVCEELLKHNTKISHLLLPHPASRTVTNELYRRANGVLKRYRYSKRPVYYASKVGLNNLIEADFHYRDVLTTTL